ncbi:MAG: alanine dehydrogenase, partial [Thermodesulfovibrionales bacterium]|nr:alanine dehydrogenase [Thermodesulfovibrionales bacterium]
MTVGVPKEIKKAEYRVGLTPSGVRELKREGHRILIEKGAGEGSGFQDSDYLNSGAEIVDRETLFKQSALIVKVKEPLPEEFHLFREGQALFTYLHLAPNEELIRFLLKKKITGLAYETLEKDGTLPLLAPMSEIAGRMAPLVGAFYLQRFHNGRGILFSGVPGIKPAKLLIIGAGVVGTASARIGIGLGMDVTVINRGIERLKRIDELFSGIVKTLVLNEYNLFKELKDADIIIGSILVPGARTPVLITRDMLKEMKKGSVIVDVSIDQGGVAETSRPTNHEEPIYEVEGIIHYCVSN